MQQPIIVRNALRLLYLGLLIGAMHLLVQQPWLHLPSYPPLSSDQVLSNFVVCTLFSYSFTPWLFCKIEQGRHWARVVLLVLNVSGLLLGLLLALVLRTPFFDAFGSGWSGRLSTMLDIAALVMLFSPQARPWFRPLAEPSINSAPHHLTTRSSEPALRSGR